MKEFKCIYIDEENQEKTGVFEAADKNQMAKTLQSFGYKIINIKEIKDNPLDINIEELIFGIPNDEITSFTIQTATMLEAGLTILAALDVLTEQTSRISFRKIIKELRRDVAGGTKFSDAIARFPSVFNDLYVSMVKVGEATGQLDVVLLRLAEFLEEEEELKSHIKSAMMYPMFLLFVAGGVILFLLSFVLPRFIDIFNSFGVELPKITQLLLTISGFFGAHWKLIFAIVFGIIILGYRFLKTNIGKKIRR